MASSHSTIVFILVTLGVLATLVSATEYTVGDENGWTLDFDYQTWAKDKVFVVGDKLGMLYMYNSFYIGFLYLILGSRTMLISYKPFFFLGNWILTPLTLKNWPITPATNTLICDTPNF
ncbi:putative cupredoxin, phytocyanin [Helianthus anomalus]